MSIQIQHCAGCHDDFYNHNQFKGCWNREKGKMVERIPVGMWQPPPYDTKKRKLVPDCWHGSGNQRTIMVKPEALDKEGYWK
jgi:hypothetical protein